MQGEPLSARKLQEAALDRWLADRRALLSAVSDLLAGRESAFSDREATLFQGILSDLTAGHEAALRHGLAEHISGCSDVPKSLVLALANEAIEMAPPALVFAGGTTATVTEAAYHRLMAHLVAGAATPGSAGPFAEGRQATVRRLLARPETNLVAAAEAYLVQEAGRLNAFQDPVLGRKDLAQEDAELLLWHLVSVLRHQIAVQFDVDMTEVDHGLEQAALGLLGNEVRPMEEAGSAERLAAELLGEDRPGPEVLESLLWQGEVTLFEALFAGLLAIPLRYARRILYARSQTDFAYACRALDLSVDGYVALQKLLWRGRLASSNDDSDVPVSEVFEAVDQQESQALLNFWRLDPRYLDAVTQAHASDTDGSVD